MTSSKWWPRAILLQPRFFGVGVEIAAAHARAEIAGILVDAGYDIEDLVSQKRSAGMPKIRALFLDDFPVVSVVARVHHEKDELKRKFIVAMLLDLLHELGDEAWNLCRRRYRRRSGRPSWISW